MISYDPFWKTLEASDETYYTLTVKHHIPSSTMKRLKHNEPLTTTTLNDLCRILHCRIENVMEYIPSEADQIL